MSIADRTLNSQLIYMVIKISVAEQPTVCMPIKARLDKRVNIFSEQVELATESYRKQKISRRSSDTRG
jgi:hypothetical protein